MSMGILRVALEPGVWTQLPDQAANSIWFQGGDFDLASSGTPGENYMNIRADDGPFSVNTGGSANTNALWARSQGNPIVLLWEN
jgi:hypothetical protein